jgi:tetratricopeptide (TPR) repeat protein
MFFRLQLLLLAVALSICVGVSPASAQDFQQLVDKASEAWGRGACRDAAKGFADAIESAQKRVGVVSISEQVRITLLRSEALLCLGNFDGAIELAKSAAKSPASSDGAIQSQINFLLAEAAVGNGQYAEAEKESAEALRLANETLTPDDPRRVRYLTARADLSRLRGQYGEAQSLLQDAFVILDKRGASKSIERAYALLAYGDLARDRDRWDEARTRYNEALAIANPKDRPEHPVAAHAWLGLGLVELAAGRLNFAEDYLGKARRASNKLTSSANFLDAQDAMGMLDLFKRNLKDAQEGLETSSTSRPANRPGSAASLDHLGLVYLAEQKWAEASSVLQKAESIRRDVLGPDHPDLAVTLYHLGGLSRLQKNFPDSAKYLDEALKIQIARLGPDSLAVASTRTEQANLLADQNRLSDAETLYRQAFKIEENLTPPGAPMHLATLYGLALALHEEGKDSEAGPMLAEWMKNRGDALLPLDIERVPAAIALAEIDLDAKNFVEAETRFAAILPASGNAIPQPPRVQKGLADALFGQRKFREASRYYAAALPKLSGHSPVRRGWENLGASYVALNQWPDSIQSYQRALDAANNEGAPEADKERIVLMLADVCSDAGRTDQAFAYVNQWLTTHARRGEPLSSDEAAVLEKSSRSFMVAKQYAQAESVLRFLLEAAEKPGTQGVNVNRTLTQLAESCANQNKNAEAAGLYQRLAAKYREIRRLGDSEQNLLRAKEFWEKDTEPNATGLISTLQELGEIYVQESKLDKARPVFDQSLKLLQENGLTDDPRVAASLNGLGEVLQGEKNLEEAKKQYLEAERRLGKLTDPPKQILAPVLYNIGLLEVNSRELEQATQHFKKALELGGGFSSEQLEQIANTYGARGSFDDAEKLYKESLDQRRKFYGESSAKEAEGFYSLAVFYRDRKKYGKAAEAGESALHIHEARTGQESDEVALVLALLANIYNASGEVDRALAAEERSLTIQEKLGQPRGEVTTTLSDLGELYRRRNDYPKALEVYRKMANLWESESFVNLNYQRAVLNMAIAYVHISDVEHGNESFERLQKGLQRQSSQMKDAADKYAKALSEMGYEKDARRIRDGANTRGPNRK